MQAEIGLAIVEAMKSWESEGLAKYALPTLDVVVESHGNFRRTVEHLFKGAETTPHEGGRMTCFGLAVFFAVDYPRKLVTDDFDLSQRTACGRLFQSMFVSQLPDRREVCAAPHQHPCSTVSMRA